eukprot:TRINITY_DN13209_c0_g1_i1.p1 TRINITY_DN13209_c0_g1~~TRINITY_DN13209_c0_g1_i1.p1  ORF type:complete len:351 (-),score=98.41 TRINITY_DN13209_c0_g1_i1:447-1463(-)
MATQGTEEMEIDFDFMQSDDGDDDLGLDVSDDDDEDDSEKEIIDSDLDEVRQYNEVQVRAEVRRLNLLADPNEKMRPAEVRRILNRNEILFSINTDKNPEDAVQDARLIKNLSHIVRKNVEEMSASAMTFQPEEFAQKLCKKLDSKRDNVPFITKDMLVKFGFQIKGVMAKSPSLSILNGALQGRPQPKEKKERRQRQKTKDSDLVATQAVVLTETETTESHGDKKVVTVLKCLGEIYKQGNRQPVNYFQFVIDPKSFSTTVENMFHVSYLVKEGKVDMRMVDGIPCIKPYKNKDKSGQSRENRNEANQVVVNMSMYQWQRLAGILGDSAPLLKPNKN